ncbi:MAG: LppX_LprAFG lipoprotein [Chloroflexi bacterium]|nr:LppX_LprAFG lipoprotein [Chloroflexota bacterium]
MKHINRLALALSLLFTLFLVACGGNDETATPTTNPDVPPTATLTPAETLAQVAEVMLSLDGVQIEFSRSGGPVYVDEDGLLVFSSATVLYDAPDKVQARVKALTSNTALELGFIAVGDKKWLTNPATLAWEPLPGTIQLDLALLFDAIEGWRPLLTTDASNIQWVETTSFGGVTRDHYQATVAGQRAAAITSGLVPPQDITLDIFIDPATRYVTQLEFSTPTASGQDAEWILQFSEFGLDVEIVAPE